MGFSHQKSSNLLDWLPKVWGRLANACATAYDDDDDDDDDDVDDDDDLKSQCAWKNL